MRYMTLEFEISQAEYAEALRAMPKPSGDWYRSLRIAGITCAGFGMAMFLGCDGFNRVAPAILILLGLAIPIRPLFIVAAAKDEAWQQYSVSVPLCGNSPTITSSVSRKCTIPALRGSSSIDWRRRATSFCSTRETLHALFPSVYFEIQISSRNFGSLSGNNSAVPPEDFQ
jgi:hypothetical protein